MLSIPASLAAALTDLDAALDDDPGPTTARLGLPSQLRALGELTREAVPSLLGLAVVLRLGSETVVLSAFEPGASPSDARSSVRVPLLAGPGAGVDLVVLAAEPGDCSPLAAHAARDEPGLAGPVVDHDLGGPDTAAVTGLAELSRTNQAVGVLVARGRSVAAARAEIDTAAARSGTSTAAVAARVLGGRSAVSAPDGPCSAPGRGCARG